MTGTTIGGTHPEWITSGSERPMGGTLAPDEARIVVAPVSGRRATRRPR